MGQFAVDVGRFSQKTGIALDRAVRMIVIEVGSSIIRMTPVGNPDLWKNPDMAPPGYVGGRLKGEWQFTIQPATAETGRIDSGGSQATAKLVGDSIQFKAGMVGYITNLMPYAIPIEMGGSKQAPGGMVRITLERFQNIVNKAIREHRV